MSASCIQPGMEHRSELFTGRVDNYQLYRERYDPAIVFPRLRAWCGLAPAWHVADIGAGTGMLAELFLANGNPVIAIEPNAEMRAACKTLLPGADVRDGTAEATGLAAHSVDLVSVGRALHWFDFDAAIAEFRRILRPGGWLAVIASGRAETGRPENDALEELLRRFSNVPSSTRAGYASYHRLSSAFDSGTFHHDTIAGEMSLTWHQLRGYVLSISHAPRMDAPNFPHFESALREIFEAHQSDDFIQLLSRHWINAGRFEPTA